MHAGPASNEDVVYKTVNWFSSDRFIYFFADPPHLIKTARNCLAKSGSGNASRLLWNDGSHLLWSHIADLFYEDLECGLHLLPRLTYDHIRLNSYSVMNVKLAAQVLSSTVSCTLKKFGPPDAQGTAKFCELMDTFFDCLNVRNTKEHVQKQKPALMPYTSIDDERFGWLNNTFLQYFEDWLSSIERKPSVHEEAIRLKENDEAWSSLSDSHPWVRVMKKCKAETLNFLIHLAVDAYNDAQVETISARSWPSRSLAGEHSNHLVRLFSLFSFPCINTT